MIKGILFFIILIFSIINIDKDVERLEVEQIKREKTKELHYYKVINSNYTSNSETLLNIINPFSGYIIADYYIGSEIQDEKVDINLDYKQNLEDIVNYDIINDKSIIMCQVNKLKYFVENILPKINSKVILITGQNQLPQVNKSTITDKIIYNPNIILWFSQNPLYEYRNVSKYNVFPYGLRHDKCFEYYKFLISNKDVEKSLNISNLYCKTHDHLPHNHIRKLYPIFSKEKKMHYKDYLTKISKSKYLISPAGDRYDCYRHYEAIGLNTIPISNIGFLYKKIFGDNMLYLDIIGILKAIKYGKVVHEFKEPNRDIITTTYWKEWINKIIYSPN